MSSQSNQGTITILDRGEYLTATISTQQAETTAALDEVFGVLPPRDGQSEGPRQFNWNQAQEDNVDLVDDAVLGVQEASKNHRSTKILVAGEFRNRGVAGVLISHYVAGFLGAMETNIQAFEAAQASLNEAKKLRDQAYAAKRAALKRLRRPALNPSRNRLRPPNHPGGRFVPRAVCPRGQDTPRRTR